MKKGLAFNLFFTVFFFFYFCVQLHLSFSMVIHRIKPIFLLENLTMWLKLKKKTINSDENYNKLKVPDIMGQLLQKNVKRIYLLLTPIEKKIFFFRAILPTKRVGQIYLLKNLCIKEQETSRIKVSISAMQSNDKKVYVMCVVVPCKCTKIIGRKQDENIVPSPNRLCVK